MIDMIIVFFNIYYYKYIIMNIEKVYGLFRSILFIILVVFRLRFGNFILFYFELYFFSFFSG